MSSLPPKLALATATVLLLVSCGDTDPPDPSGDSSTPESTASSGAAEESPSAGSTADPNDRSSASPAETGTPAPGGAVTRGEFCGDLDPTQVGEILGISGAEVIGSYAPGDEIPSGTDGAPIVSPHWTCTIGTTTDNAIGATWNVGSSDATSKEMSANLRRQSATLGAENCSSVTDETLGSDTRGIDCSRTFDGTAIALAARSNLVDGTQIDCSIASTGRGDLDALVEALPEVCDLFYDVVVP